MNAQTPRSYAWIAAAIVFGAIIISATFITSSSFQKTVTSTSTLTQTTTLTTTSAYYPDLGPLLKLQVSMNATRIAAGGAMLVEIALFNLLPVNLSALPHANKTLQSWGWFDFICSGNLLSPVGFALFKGHYVSGNISTAGNPLTLTPPIKPPCQTSLSPSLYLVLPHSSNAVVYYILPTTGHSFVQPIQMRLKENATTGSCSATTTRCGPDNGLFGYWNTTGLQGPLDTATTTSKYFHYFSPGQYTLVVADEWGHTIYEYFEVVKAG